MDEEKSKARLIERKLVLQAIGNEFKFIGDQKVLYLSKEEIDLAVYERVAFIQNQKVMWCTFELLQSN